MEQSSEKPVDSRLPPAISSPVTPDARDLAAARNGDHAAFARVYDRHAAVVLSIEGDLIWTATAPDQGRLLLPAIASDGVIYTADWLTTTRWAMNTRH